VAVSPLNVHTRWVWYNGRGEVPVRHKQGDDSRCENINIMGIMKGKVVKQLRKGLGLTQAQLANALGISVGHIGNIELREDVATSDYELGRFAKALRTKPHILLGLSEPDLTPKVGIGAKVRKLRIQRGITQYDLAQRVRVSESYISRVESNGRIPPLNKLHRLAEALQVKPSALLGKGDDEWKLEPKKKSIEELLTDIYSIGELTKQQAIILQMIKELEKRRGASTHVKSSGQTYALAQGRGDEVLLKLEDSQKQIELLSNRVKALEDMIAHPERTPWLVSLEQIQPSSLQSLIEAIVGRRRAPKIRDSEALAQALANMMSTLTLHEQAVVFHRFGLDGSGQETLATVGNRLGVTKTRVQQIERKALRRLRHAKRQGILRQHMDLEETNITTSSAEARESSTKEVINMGFKIRQAREARRESLRGVAKKLGISPGYLSLIETGKGVNPSMKLLRKVKEELGVSIGYLVSEGDEDRREDIR